MTSVGLVACSKSKLHYAAPAEKLYSSDLFKKASAFARDHYDYWYVLSALHGLVHPETIVDPYDLTLRNLSARERREWAAKVISQLRTAGLFESAFYLHAGRPYSAYLEEPLNATWPLKGMGIGEQLAWYVARGY